MSGKKILTIGLDLASEYAETTSFDSKISLLDWDIILFFPDISFCYELADDRFKDKPALSESYYAKLKEQAAHWRRELLNAFHSNKTIIIILNEFQEIYIDSGERKYSEVDGNRKVTRLFDSYSNYNAIPLKLTPVNSNGRSIKLASNAEMISRYWEEFSDLCEYKVIFEEKLSGPLLLTEHEKIVGAYVKNKSSEGLIILLPFLNFNNDISSGHKFLKAIMEIDESSKQSPDLINKATKQVQELDGRTPKQTPEIIEKASKQSLDATEKSFEQATDIMPIPTWIKDALFELPKEIKLKKELLKIESKLAAIQEEAQLIKSKIASEGYFKRLLYETGKALEDAVWKSLTLLGFESLKGQHVESEFDFVFESEEGRFLVEVAGKDEEAIGFEKLRQLELKILEDYAREDVDKIAKGLLFGNTYRLQELNSRNDFFTEKCFIAAKRNSIALARTPDLFWVVQYLSDNNDLNYAKKCREAILQSEGELVKFPEPPKVLNSLE